MIEVERWGAVALVELHRPRQRNAIDAAMATALADALRVLDGDDSVRAVVLAGAGPSFCTGADMHRRLEGRDGSAEVFASVRRASRAVADLSLPIVAAVHGHALGAGLELAARCDYRVAERGATLALPEVTQGITSGGGLLGLASLAGRGTLARLAFGAGHLGGAEAAALGVVDELVDDGRARAVALERAGEFAGQPRAALVAAKRALRMVTEPLAEEQWERLGRLQQSLEGGPAQREALERLSTAANRTPTGREPRT